MNRCSDRRPAAIFGGTGTKTRAAQSAPNATYHIAHAKSRLFSDSTPRETPECDNPTVRQVVRAITATVRLKFELSYGSYCRAALPTVDPNEIALLIPPAV